MGKVTSATYAVDCRGNAVAFSRAGFAVLVWCFVGFVSLSQAIAGPSHSVRTIGRDLMKLKGVEYIKAKIALQSQGWKAAPGPCYTDKETCQKFPEIDACSVSLPVMCGMLFVRDNQCLAIGTSGESPPGFEQGDPVVDVVRFVPSPCAKNP